MILGRSHPGSTPCLYVIMMMQIGTEPSDNQYLVVDIGMAAVPIIMIGNSGPYDVLVKQKPQRHLLSFLPLFSVISYLFFQALCYVGIWFYVQSQPWSALSTHFPPRFLVDAFYSYKNYIK